jgi:hypothetical protein
MTESELDSLYTQLCQTMTDLGEARCQLFLARFALLAVVELDGMAVAQRLIAQASDGLDGVVSEPVAGGAGPGLTSGEEKGLA